MKLQEAEISVVGCGGIGSWLLPPLLRFLAYEGFEQRILLWDGDHYTTGNAKRQEFPEGTARQNKARVQVERFRTVYPGLLLEAREEYVSDSNVSLCVKEGALIFSCVDNHGARVRLDRAAAGLMDICIFSTGNELLDGMCCVHYVSDGEPITQSVLKRHPEIERSAAINPNDPSCEANIQTGATQLLVTNFVAAAATLSAFHAFWVKGQPARRKTADYDCTPQEVVFDLRRCEMGSVSAV
jgi:molybdopterin/thiamine biosynthesis adenylyltransferase